MPCCFCKPWVAIFHLINLASHCHHYKWKEIKVLNKSLHVARARIASWNFCFGLYMCVMSWNVRFFFFFFITVRGQKFWKALICATLSWTLGVLVHFFCFCNFSLFLLMSFLKAYLQILLVTICTCSLMLNPFFTYLAFFFFFII